MTVSLPWLLRRIRVIVFFGAFVLAVALYAWVFFTIPPSSARTIRLSEVFALMSFALLYFALLASPFCEAFPQFRFRSVYLTARRALGVSAFFFGLLHASVSFFRLLGGFAGLAYLSTQYRTAMTLGFLALCILGALAATSFNTAARLMGKKWKWLHRLVYLAGVLIMIHALLLGSHFSDFSAAIPQTFFVALAVLTLLEARRADRALARVYPRCGHCGPSTLFIAALLIGTVFVLVLAPESRFSLAINGRHLQQVKQVQQ